MSLYYESLKIYNKNKKSDFEKEKQLEYEEEVEWFMKNGLDLNDLNELQPSYIHKFVYIQTDEAEDSNVAKQIEKEQKLPINLDQEPSPRSQYINVEMDTVNMLDFKYLHNKITGLGSILPPFYELKYSRIKDKYVKKIENLKVKYEGDQEVFERKKDKLVVKMKKEVKEEMFYSLSCYIKSEKYLMV